MPKYVITTPLPSGTYSLTKTMHVGGPPPVGTYTSYGSLQGWWRLNEDVASTGDVTDSSGKSRTGVFDSSAERPAFSPTRYPSVYIQSSSCTFDGNNDAINIGSATAWDAVIGNNTSSGSTEKMSFSAWVYKTGDGGGNSGEILDFGGTDIGFYTGATERIFLSAKWNGNNTVKWRTRDANPFPLNAWTHIVVTYDATDSSNDPEFYVNGTLVATEHSSGTKTGDYYGIVSQDGFIGNRSDKTYSWEGQLADVAIWNSILTADEIKALYNSTAGPFYYTYRNYDLVGYGERLSPTGSQYQMSLQGIDTHKDDIYYPSLLPRIRQGAPMSLWRSGDKLPDTYFDDTLTMNPNPNDMRGENDIKITQRVNFDWEQLVFGQAPTTQQGTPYVETQRFDPVAFLQSSEETMWPVNLFNLGSLLDHEFDGVIEPFDIRQEALGISDNRYEGHAVRGGLTGGAAETYFGSKQIVDTWRTTDAKMSYFLDAPINWGTIPVGAYSNITQEPSDALRDTTAFDSTHGILFLNNPSINGSPASYTLLTGSALFSKEADSTAYYFPLPKPAGWWRLNIDISGSAAAVAAYDGAIDSSDYGIIAYPNQLVDSHRSQWPVPTSTPASSIQTNSNYFDNDDTSLRIYDDSYGNPSLTHLSFTDGAGTDSACSFHFRFKGDFPEDGGASTYYYLFAKTNFGPLAEYEMFLYDASPRDGSCSLYVRFMDDSTVDFIGQRLTGFFSNNTWYDVVITYDASATSAGIKIYVDGVQRTWTSVYESGSYTAMSRTTGDGWIGSYGLGNSFMGHLADVACWAVELTQTEIKALYEARNGVYRDGLSEDPLISAMRLLSTGSQVGIDPNEERANHGFYFDKNIGSIIFGDW